MWLSVRLTLTPAISRCHSTGTSAGKETSVFDMVCMATNTKSRTNVEIDYTNAFSVADFRQPWWYVKTRLTWVEDKMAIFNRFFCWPLQTASFVGYIFVTFTSFFALVLRLLDVAATFDSDFEISQGFHSHWRSHAWDGFVVTDLLMVITHTIVFIFSIFMLYLTTRRHFIMTISWSQFYLIYFVLYVLCELACSLYEFGFYGVNTFRLAFVVFIWLYWLVRILANTVFAFVLWARYQEMNESMDKELKFAGEKRNGYI